MGEGLSAGVQEPGLTWSLSCISHNPPRTPSLVCLFVVVLATDV